jgi:hypothetical protein
MIAIILYHLAAALMLCWVAAGILMLVAAVTDKSAPVAERFFRANLALMALGVGTVGLVLLESIVP